eukprot:CAMPEP_0184058746 /NCGR_PEP_ID=MMETSP0956-20121227/9482_1 /TAXON_ID=627963 /ORGANISM="Aplanochytrium sp, Strain PBS07" /LENGTH=43 /DNA_ID= /DNA_START= /DNA_END= /DNA_ORIENTATION=
MRKAFSGLKLDKYLDGMEQQRVRNSTDVTSSQAITSTLVVNIT